MVISPAKGSVRRSSSAAATSSVVVSPRNTARARSKPCSTWSSPSPAPRGFFTAARNFERSFTSSVPERHSSANSVRVAFDAISSRSLEIGVALSSSSSSSDGARLLKIEDATVSSSGVVGEKLLAACIRAAAEEGRPLLERWARCGLSRRFLRAGERLDGEEDAAYLVLSGRLRSFLYDEKHRVANVRDFKRGDVLNVNEILLTQTRKRPFCVERCAARDTEIIVLPRAALDRFLPASCSLNLVRRQLVLKEEKQRSNRVTLATVDATVLCVLPTSPTTSQLARSLGEALAGPGDGLEGASLQSADNDDDDDDDAALESFFRRAASPQTNESPPTS
mmetsp:Transcript_18710/g.57544  ORF Transcript_18710/g.57544 Transcript_18710/m.57544 type:complete len:337 (+) Transcript_18710:1772-2782(+)